MRELTDLERNLLDADRWHDLACLRLDLLERLHARAQRLEATLVLVEDQRDAARAELARLHRAHAIQSEAYRDGAADFWNVVAQRHAAIAERDAARAELAQLKSDLLAGG